MTPSHAFHELRLPGTEPEPERPRLVKAGWYRREPRGFKDRSAGCLPAARFCGGPRPNSGRRSRSRLAWK